MSEPRPEEQLGPVLQFMRVLWGLDHSLQMASKRMEARLGITGPQRLVVRLVGQFPGISAGELASLQKVHPSTLTGVLRRLEARSILKRRSDPADGRRALLHLTAKGVRLNELRSGTVEEAVQRAIGKLDAGQLDGAQNAIVGLMQELEEQAVEADRETRGAAAKAPTRTRR